MLLTTAEYNQGQGKVLKAFAAAQTKNWQEMIYRVRSNYSNNNGMLLFLFAYALDTWDHTDGATNYLTEKEMMAIIAKANQLSA